MPSLIFHDASVRREGTDYVIEQGDQRITLSKDQAKQIALFLNPRKSPSQQPNMAGFDQFWAKYPRKEAKIPAAKAWGSSDAASHLPAILADIARRKTSDSWKKGFIPHPATYLNQRRWEDGGTEQNTFEGVI